MTRVLLWRGAGAGMRVPPGPPPMGSHVLVAAERLREEALRLWCLHDDGESEAHYDAACFVLALAERLFPDPPPSDATQLWVDAWPPPAPG